MAKKQRIASYAFIVHDGHVLLAQHGVGPNKGRWGFPGGGVEYGEDPLESLKRELAEECSIAADNYELEGILSVIVEADPDDAAFVEFHNVGILYRATVPSLLSVKSDQDGMGCLGSRWFSFDELNNENVSRPIQNFLRAKKILKT